MAFVKAPCKRRAAILGATGLVGRTILALLEERGFPLDSLRLLASERLADRRLPFRGESLPVEPVSSHAFDGVEIAWFATKNDISQKWAGAAREAGARVIDNSSAFR